MISFELTEEQKLAQAMVREVAESSIRPAARDADEHGAIPDSILKHIWSTGIIQSQATTDAGDGSRSPTMNALLLEELAVADAAFAIAAAAPMGFVSAIAAYGSSEQKSRLLPLFTGDNYHCAGVAIMEPGFLFDVSALRTSAKKTNRGYRLSGVKSMVPLAQQCSHYLVIAECEGSSDVFIVDRRTKGVTISDEKPKLGLRALRMGSVNFREVELDANDRLGGAADDAVQEVVDSARTALAAIMAGISRAVFEFVMPYTKERVVHGDALAKKQVIAFRLADMRIETDAMRWMTWKAASILEQGASATRQAQLAYTYAVEQALWIADEGVQMLGGHGYLRDNPVEMWYRDARTVSVMEGAVGV
ncbi:MAG: acyl-CoA dehydrogenase family protein [Candidatus Binataceae bacterium]